MNNGIIKGETHCDTIEDYFNNPYILRVLRSYYRLKRGDFIKSGEKLSIWISKQNKDKGFTHEFFSFIQNIFKDSGEFESFLSFVKAECYDNKKKRDAILYKYGKESIVRVLLCFRETLNQVSYDSYGQSYTQTMQSIFSTRIIDILRSAFHDSFDEEETINIYTSIEQLILRGYCPISPQGEMLGFIREGDNGGVEVAPMTGGESYEIFKQGDIYDNITSRQGVLEKIRQLHRIKDCFHNESSRAVLNKKDRDFFDTLSEDFQLESGLTFEEFLEDIIRQLNKYLPKLPVSDTTMQVGLIREEKLTPQGHPILGVISGDGARKFEGEDLAGKLLSREKKVYE